MNIYELSLRILCTIQKICKKYVKNQSKTMAKTVKTYPGKNREIWEEFREFPGKNIAISREFPGREIPAVNPKQNINSLL